jgi:hypothetical protein
MDPTTSPSVPPDTHLPLPSATSQLQPSLAELEVVVLPMHTDVQGAHVANAMGVLDHVEIENLDLGDVAAIDPEVIGGPGHAMRVDAHGEKDEDGVAWHRQRTGCRCSGRAWRGRAAAPAYRRSCAESGRQRSRRALGEADMANVQPEVIHAAGIDRARRDEVVLVVGLDHADPGLRGVNAAAVAEHAGGRGTARKLIELGTVPQLTSIGIIEYTLDANAAKALIAACKVHLPRLAKLVLDLAYRDSDYFNEAGENDHLMNLPHLGPELFVAFPHLAHLAITRFLIGDLLHIPAYLRPHLQRFRVLDGFGEELEELADRGTIHVPTSWAGCFSYGIDYEVPDVSTLRTLAEQSFDAAIQAMRHNVAVESAAKFNVELRATGNLGQPFTTVNYFEEDAGH